MFEEIINKVLEAHDDFNYYEIEEICQDFYDKIPSKIKEETKLKRVWKYIIKELYLYLPAQFMVLKTVFYMKILRWTPFLIMRVPN